MRTVDLQARLRRDLPVILGLGAGTRYLEGTVLAVRERGWGWDSRAYYQAARHLTYSGLPNTSGAYLYSPVFAQMMHPLALLPWPIFAGAWSLTAFLTLNFLLRGVWWPWRVTLLYLSIWEVVSGNIHWAIAAAVAFGLAYPACWAFPALTKIAPGVGMLWFLLRREWRHFATASVTTVVLALISLLITPRNWADWAQLLLRSLSVAPSMGPYFSSAPLRLLLSLVLVAVAAQRSWRWLLPVAVCLSLPNWAPPALIVLYALPRLLQSAPAHFPLGPADGDGPRTSRADATHLRGASAAEGMRDQ